jgi:hypothetical protein
LLILGVFPIIPAQANELLMDFQVNSANLQMQQKNTNVIIMQINTIIRFLFQNRETTDIILSNITNPNNPEDRDLMEKLSLPLA